MVPTRSGRRQRVKSLGKRSANLQRVETEDEVHCVMAKVRLAMIGGCGGGVRVIEGRDIVAAMRTIMRTNGGLGSEMN